VKAGPLKAFKKREGHEFTCAFVFEIVRAFATEGLLAEICNMNLEWALP